MRIAGLTAPLLLQKKEGNHANGVFPFRGAYVLMLRTSVFKSTDSHSPPWKPIAVPPFGKGGLGGI